MQTTTTHRDHRSAMERSRMLGTATVAAGSLYTGFAALQIALAAGAPIGSHVWGGGNDPVQSPGMRVASAVAAVVLLTMAVVVVDRAGPFRKVSPFRASWLKPATWIIAGYMVLNAAGNFASSSAIERGVFGPATVLMALSTAYIAARGTRG